MNKPDWTVKQDEQDGKIFWLCYKGERASVIPYVFLVKEREPDREIIDHIEETLCKALNFRGAVIPAKGKGGK